MSIYDANGKVKYEVVRERCERVRAMIIKRARRETLAAGLDPDLIGVHLHNALVGLHYGKPWPGIDYKKVRRAKRLFDEVSARPGRLLDQLYERKRTSFYYERF